MGLCTDLKDQSHQWHSTVQAALSRAVPFLPRKMRHQGQPLDTNRSHSLLEEMKRNALQQTELCKHLPPAENIRLCCLVLHPGKQSMDTSHLEKLSCPGCWEKNPYFDTEAKYQKLFIQPALAMSSARFSLISGSG